MATKAEVIRNLPFSVQKGYASTFALGNTVIATTCDGVGTKLRLAVENHRLDTVGIDCVAMVVNDLLCVGAKPSQFLDYLAYQSLGINEVLDILKGIQVGCAAANCHFVGGETAEMDTFYHPGDFDLCGFGVGIVQDNFVPEPVEDGDVLVGMRSSGPHSNGFTQYRMFLPTNDPKWIDWLMTPTRIYTEIIEYLPLIKCLAHISGGGMYGKLPRILHGDLQAEITLGDWVTPEFYEVKRFCNYTWKEMFSHFNCGIGMVVACTERNASKLLTQEHFYHLGNITKSKTVIIPG